MVSFHVSRRDCLQAATLWRPEGRRYEHDATGVTGSLQYYLDYFWSNAKNDITIANSKSSVKIFN